jgi:hypothetical protein
MLTLEEIEKNKPIKLTILEASKVMNVTPRFLQLALQQKRFNFGIAVEGDRWTYYINTERFIKYMKGENVKEAI